jgi:phosphatidylglycerol:prolipoprotein diacylglycerol transferase
MGNFINGELYGRVTTLPWGMIFPRGGSLLRHPSQLYESALEGGVLFAILWFLKDKKLPIGGLLALFIFFYGCFRFFVEFFREPDAHIGFIIGPFTLGQAFSFIMITGGVILYVYRKIKD